MTWRVDLTYANTVLDAGRLRPGHVELYELAQTRPVTGRGWRAAVQRSRAKASADPAVGRTKRGVRYHAGLAVGAGSGGAVGMLGSLSVPGAGLVVTAAATAAAAGAGAATWLWHRRAGERELRYWRTGVSAADMPLIFAALRQLYEDAAATPLLVDELPPRTGYAD